MLFAIDHGNSAVKTTNFVFTSGLAEYPVKPPLQTDVLEGGGVAGRGGKDNAVVHGPMLSQSIPYPGDAGGFLPDGHVNADHVLALLV